MPNDRTYDDKVIYLTELLDRRAQCPMLEGFTFTGCHVLGPAVVALIGNNTLNGCRFRNDQDAMLYEVPEGSTKVGIIGLANCTFTDLSLIHI